MLYFEVIGEQSSRVHGCKKISFRSSQFSPTYTVMCLTKPKSFVLFVDCYGGV